MRRLVVEGTPLLRVLPVGQVALLAQDDAQLLGEARSADVVEVGRDLALVGGQDPEGLGRQALAHLGRDGSVLADLIDEHRVVSRVAHGGHAPEVPRGRSEQREAADIDHLDRLVDGHHPTAHLGRERPDADDHDVDRPDAVSDQALEILGHVSTRQDASVDLRVVGLDLIADQAVRIGQPGDSRDLHPGLGQLRPCAVSGIDLDPLVEQLARKIDDAGAIRDREQGSHSAFLLPRCHASLPVRRAGDRVYPRRVRSLCAPRAALLPSTT